MNSENKNEEERKFPIGVKILIGILAFVLLCGIGVFAFVQSQLGKMNEAKPNTEVVIPAEETFEVDEEEQQVTVPVEELDPDEIDLHITSDVMKDKDIVNILLIGQDRRSGEGRARSDSMIVATLNKKNKTIHLTSFMRDLYVELPGDYSGNRLNAAYQFGGMELLDETLKMNFGIQIDGNIEVDFSGFQQCVDAVGGIDLELNQDEADYLNRRGNWDVNNAGAGTWNLKAGMNHLDGEKALAFSRVRGIGHADYERTQRQRRVLTEMFKKAKNSDISTMLTLVDQLFPLLTTDISKFDMLGYGAIVLGVDSSDIASDRIPINGGFKPAIVRGMQVLVPDLEKNRQHLQETLYGKTQ